MKILIANDEPEEEIVRLSLRQCGQSVHLVDEVSGMILLEISEHGFAIVGNAEDCALPTDKNGKVKCHE